MDLRNRTLAATLALMGSATVLWLIRRDDVTVIETSIASLAPKATGPTISHPPRATGSARADAASPQPSVLAQRAEAMPPGPEQDRALREAALAFVQQDPFGALAWALTLPDASTRGAVLDIVMRERVSRDARGTLAELAAMPSSLAVDEALSAAAGFWARENASDALAWLRQMPDAGQRARLLGSIGYELAEDDPRAALRLAGALANEDRQLFIASVVTAWAARDSRGAVEWAREQAPSAARDQILAQIASGIALVDPSQAAMLVQQFPPGAVHDHAALDVARRWSERDPRAAADWASTFPDEALRSRCVAQTVAQWSAAQFNSAAQWVLALPVGETRIQAIAAHVEVLKIEGIPQAAAWLGSLPATDQNEKLIEDLAREWLPGNRRQAEAWLARTALSPEHRQRILDQAAERNSQ